MVSGFERLVVKRRKPPRPRDFIPGIGGPYYNGNYSPDTPPGRPNSSTQRQQAPFKSGQTARTQRLKRRTRPTPGSAYRRQNPRVD